MKQILLIALTFFSFNAFADSQNFDKYFCQEYNRSTGEVTQRSVVLVPTSEGKEKLDEDGHYLGYEASYRLEMYKGAEVFPHKTVDGTVLTEDVHFQFVSEDEETTFFIYLDEMEESSLTFTKGRRVRGSYDYVCRF